MKSVTILGVRIDDLSINEAVDLVRGWLDTNKGSKKYYIVTPNPEFLMLGSKDPEFRKILNDSDLSIPDGVGLKLSGKIKNVTTGVDLMEKLVKLASENGFTVGLLGGKDGVAEKTAERLKKRYPDLKITFAEDGPKVDEYGVESIEYSAKGNTLHTPYTIPHTDILFVAFGQGKQERWIHQNLAKTDAKVMMGVGGAFDYLSGKVVRAPFIVRKIGFEWLFRLVIQPWRIKRQLVLLKFVILVLKERFRL